MRIGWMPVCRADDFGEQLQSRVAEFEFFHDGVERNIFAVMPEFAALNVERRRAKFLGLGFDLLHRHKDKFGLGVNELLDEPRTRHAVHFHFLTSDPFHSRAW